MKHFYKVANIEGILGCPHCPALISVDDLKPRPSSCEGCQVEADCPECGKTSCLTPGLSGPRQANTPATNPDLGKTSRSKNKF